MVVPGKEEVGGRLSFWFFCERVIETRELVEYLMMSGSE